MKIPNDIINIVRKILIKYKSDSIIKQYHYIYELEDGDALIIRGGFFFINNRIIHPYFNKVPLIYKLGTSYITGKLPKNY